MMDTEWYENCAQAIVTTLKPVVDAITPAAEAFMERVYNAYLDAGAPYGYTNDGMMRWVKEIGKIAYAEEAKVED